MVHQRVSICIIILDEKPLYMGHLNKKCVVWEKPKFGHFNRIIWQISRLSVIWFRRPSHTAEELLIPFQARSTLLNSQPPILAALIALQRSAVVDIRFESLHQCMRGRDLPQNAANYVDALSPGLDIRRPCVNWEDQEEPDNLKCGHNPKSHR